MSVLRKAGQSYRVPPEDETFTAERVWAQRSEHLFGRDGKSRPGFLTKIENAFQEECASILRLGLVSNHAVVSEYFAIWNIRAEFAENPPGDIAIAGLASTLTKDDEEHLEASGVAFLRGNVALGRLNASMDLIRSRDMLMGGPLANLQWSVLRSFGNQRFLSPDRPHGTLCIPMTPTVLLVAGRRSRVIGDEAVRGLNMAMTRLAREFVFGHPADMDALARGDHGFTLTAGASGFQWSRSPPRAWLISP